MNLSNNDGRAYTFSVRCFKNPPTEIELTADITAPGQTVTVNKYFANAYTIDRGDGTPKADLTADTLHTYTNAGSYTITLAFTGGEKRWTFTSISKSLVPQA